ncbi:MAG: archaemetzincin family Zn-dependent metalloprotease [Terriglobales bacterium]
MNLQLLAIGEIDRRLLEDLRARMGRVFRVSCELLENSLSVEFAFHPERRQYYSSEILARMQAFVGPRSWRVLGVAAVDLYIPILTFVFGEAQLGGRCALVSTHRLRQEFYGLPADRGILGERLLKEAVHELGHTLELTHCDDYGCVMSASHSVEWIDLKEPHLCAVCHNRVLANTGNTAT